jgi:putative membrane protein
MIALGLAVAAFAYLRGWLGAPASEPIPAWRAGSFLLGLISIGVAIASPVSSCDAGSLTGHMVQHLLLMTVAPPLIFLGEPVRAIGGPLLWKPLRWLGRELDRPVLCWIAATATLVGWHVPAAFNLALRSHAWHLFEQASFLATGLLFWWPVVAPWPSRRDPEWSMVLYLFFATLPCDILSAFLVFSDRIAYPAYLQTRSALSVLDDQQAAGALMWTTVTIVYLIAGAIVSVQLLAGSHPRQRLVGA